MLSGCGSPLTERAGGGVSGLPEWKPFRYASPAPGVPWRIKPDKADAIPGERQPGVPAELQPVASSLTLPQLLAVALDNTPVGKPGQCILQSQQLEAMVDLNEFFLSLQQFVLNIILLLHEADQAITENTQKPQQQ